MPENTQQTSNWISVKTALPDEDITMLVALSNGEVDTGFLSDKSWYDYLGGPIHGEDYVTHWQEFPEPPTQ